MTTNVLVLVCVALLALPACSTPMRESAKNIRVGKEVPNHCKELGPISGSGGGGGYTSSATKMNSAQNKLRMATEDMGGDYAVMDAVASDQRGITITGRAFDCSAPPAPVPVQVVNTAGSEAPAAAPAAPSPTVEERLQRLEKLKADGLISEEEYSTKRQAILGEL